MSVNSICPVCLGENGPERLISRSTTTHDPQVGHKPARIVLDIHDQDSRLKEATLRCITQHQLHTLTIALGTDGSPDGDVGIRERWTSGAYEAERHLPLTTIVHVLLNLSDAELADISNRPTDWRGKSTKY